MAAEGTSSASLQPGRWRLTFARVRLGNNLPGGRKPSCRSALLTMVGLLRDSGSTPGGADGPTRCPKSQNPSPDCRRRWRWTLRAMQVAPGSPTIASPFGPHQDALCASRRTHIESTLESISVRQCATESQRIRNRVNENGPRRRPREERRRPREERIRPREERIRPRETETLREERNRVREGDGIDA